MVRWCVDWLLVVVVLLIVVFVTWICFAGVVWCWLVGGCVCGCFVCVFVGRVAWFVGCW